jgi:hypothetical protein
VVIKEEVKVEPQDNDESDSDSDNSGDDVGEGFMNDEQVMSDDEEEKVLPSMKYVKKEQHKFDPKFALIQGENRKEILTKINSIASQMRP